MNARPEYRDFSPLQPGRLWSLWDIMNRFRVASYGATLLALGRAAMAIESANAIGLPEDESTDRRTISDALDQAAPSIEELPLSPVVRYQFEQILKRRDHATGTELAILIRELCNGLMVELSAAWFLMVPADQREFYEQRKLPFGEGVAQSFLEASADIAAASRCFALDEWTACVFHLMRVLEHGLRKLAGTVGLPPEAMEHENWKNIIDQIEKKIREMEALPKSAEKIARLKNLSEAAIQFRYFKDAWRNHVSHAHASYDNLTGPVVWTHVKEFMQSIANPDLPLPA
jgi:hypothetical protein